MSVTSSGPQDDASEIPDDGPIDPIFYKPASLLGPDGEANAKAEIKPVIDWRPLSQGDKHATLIAEDHGLLSRATYVHKKVPTSPGPTSPSSRNSAAFAACAGKKTAKPRDIVVFDRAAARLNDDGWPTATSIAGQEAQQYELFQTTEADIGVFGGPGMRLYFYVLKNLSVIFCLKALLAIPTMISFGSGRVYDESHLSEFGKLLARGTLGNVDDLESDVENGRAGKLWLASIMSSVSSLTLLYFTLRMGHWMKSIVAESDHQAISMSDYSVMVVPNYKMNKKPTGGWSKYKSKKEKQQVDAAGKVHAQPDASMMGGAKDKKFKTDLKRAIEERVGGAVVSANPSDESEPAIWSAWNEAANIRLWVQKYNLLSRLETGLSIASQGDAKHMESALQGLEGCNLKLATLNLDDDTAKEWQPVAAFVTFESPKLRKLALKRKSVRVGDTECDIVEAPEPESVQYRHLEYSKKARRIRRLVMLFASWTLIFLGAAGIVKVKMMAGDMAYLKECKLIYGPNEHKTHAAPSSVCPSSATVSDTTLVEMQQSYTRLIMTAKAFDVDDDGDFNAVYIPWDVQSNYGNYSQDLIGAGCHACICNAFKSEWNNYTTAGHGQLNEAYCEQFNHDKMVDTAKSLLSTAAVVAMNQILKQFIKQTTFWLRTHTIEEEMQSKASRVFAAQIMNTAILTMLLSFNLPIIDDIRAVDHFDQANFSWFAQIGAPMVKTMVIQFFVPWFMHFVFHCLMKFKVKMAHRNCMAMGQTQNQLNKCYEPNNWDIAAGYGEVLMAMSVTLIYGPGVPLLYFVAAVGFFIRYWMDKWAATRVFKKPPLYGPELIEGFDMVLAIFAFLHTFAACYYFSVAGIVGNDLQFHVEEGLHTDIDPFRPHGILLFFVFIVAGINLLYKIAIRSFPRLKDYMDARRKRLMKEAKKQLEGVANRTISLAGDVGNLAGDVANRTANLIKDGDNAAAESLAPAQVDADSQSVKVWVGGIPRHCVIGQIGDTNATLVDDLKSQVSNFGEVVSCTVRVKEAENKNWALITFTTSAACQACVEQGLYYSGSDGNKIQLDLKLADIEGQKATGGGTGALSQIAARHEGDYTAEIAVQDLEIFGGLPTRFKTQVHSKLKRLTMAQGQIAMRMGDSDGTLYFVTKGVVEVVESLDEDAQIIALVEERDCFGEELWAVHEHGSEHFWEDGVRKVFARCRTDVTLFTLEKSDLRDIAKAFDKQRRVSAKSFVKTIESVILERNQCPPFTQAVNESLIANEEEDYLSDEFEKLQDLREALLKKLEPFETEPPTETMTRNMAPFNIDGGKHLFQRILNAIHVPVSTALAQHFVKTVPMFSDLSDEHIHQVAKGMTLEYFSKDDRILKKGVEGHSFFMISSGTVGFSLNDDDKIVSERGIGEYFGEVSLLKGGVCTATAIVLSEKCTAYVLSKEIFSTRLKNVRAKIIEKLPEDQKPSSHFPHLPRRP